MKPAYCPIILLLLYLCCSCNKNSNELPLLNTGPVAPVPDSLTRTLTINSLETIQLTAYYLNTGNTVKIKLRNLTRQELTSLSVLAEICRQQPANFDNCSQVNYLAGIQLQPDRDTSLLLYINPPFVLQDSVLQTAVITCNNNNHFLAGYYGNVNAYAYFLKDTITAAGNFYGYLRGYITADGKATLRIKAPGNIFYNIYGSFSPGNNFDGYLDMNGSRQSNLKQDSFATAAGKALYDTSNNQVRFRLSLYDSLQNGVKSIDLYLKK